MTPASSPAPSGTPPIVRLDVVDSTQTAAWQLAERGAPDRTVVVADHQLTGRGRRGRSWHDEPGASLLLSIVVYPRLPVEQIPMLSLATGVAVAEALAQHFGLQARLKWPNDVLVGGRKIAGILLESRIGATPGAGTAESAAPREVSTQASTQASTDTSTDASTRRISLRPPTAGPDLAAPVTVVGIGLNLAQRAFPGALAGLATSVLLETGRSVDREATLEALLAGFDRWRACLEGEGFGPVRSRWVALSETIGRTVSASGTTGVAIDLDLDGALIVVDGARCHRIASGEIVEGDNAPRR